MGEASPRAVVVLPVLFEGEIKAVIELASFRAFTPNYLTFLDQLMASVGVILNMISVEHAHRGAPAAAQEVERRARGAGR